MQEETEGRWLTYRELGERLGCTANAARMHAHRRGWARRAPNRVGDRAMVMVPDEVAVHSRASHDAAQCVAQPNGFDQANTEAIRALVEQLGIANRRIDELQAALTDERRQLLTMLVDRRPWWRRWVR